MRRNIVETIVEEFRDADLGDQRLNHRLRSLAATLGANPTHSIPAAADSRAEWEAAYRFFDNPRINPSNVLEPHVAATVERIGQCESVVLAQDTTTVDLTRPSRQVSGAGKISSTKQRGALFHPLLALNEDALSLGIVWQKHWARPAVEKKLTKKQKAKIRRETPIEQKESYRWIEGMHAAVDVARQCEQTQCIAVADGESDIYETLVACTDQSLPENFQFVIRAGQDRSTTNGNDWLDEVRQAPCRYKCPVTVSARRAKFRSKANSAREGDRDARTADLEIRATQVTLSPPSRPNSKLPEVTVNLVLCEEPNPPSGAHPIRWLLVTQLPISSEEEIKRVIDSYCVRWQIEIFFRTLKSGCRIEERLFQTLPRTMNAIALYSVIAWRILYLTQVGRECPEVGCDVVFSASEWKSVYTVVNRHRKDFAIPKEPPLLNDMIKMIASLGGYIDRPRKKSNPGPKSLWLGLQRAHSLSMAWNAFGPESKKFAHG